MSSPTHDAAEDPQEAFRQFMLHGAKKKSPSTTTPPPPTPLSHMTSSASSSSKPRRGNNAPLTAFRKTLQQDWWPNDDVLYQVVASIADLRKRINLIRKQQQQQAQKDDNDTLGTTTTFRWKDSIQPQTNFLTANDLDLALSHALCKHETAMHNLRSLLAQQASYQQALGRRLQEIFMDDTTTGVASTTACTRIFQVAAADLYQKQKWAAAVLLLGNNMEQTPSFSLWSRTHPDSPWQQIQSHDYPWESNS